MQKAKLSFQNRKIRSSAINSGRYNLHAKKELVMTRQEEWLDKIRGSLNEKYYRDYKANTILAWNQVFWMNPVNKEALRLKPLGYNWLQKYCTLPYWEVNVNIPSMPLSSLIVLQLSRGMTAPFYINQNRTSRNTVTGEERGFITFWDETPVIMLTLNGGNIKKYMQDLNNV